MWMSSILILLACLLHQILPNFASEPPFDGFPAIFQFGDSLSDTGNSLIAFPNVSQRLNNSPYGMTFFHRPAGRESDGRLIIDFLASKLQFPLLNPFLKSGNANYLYGVNFAVCGALALGFDFYKQNNISLINSYTFPLDIQLQWFKAFRRYSALNSPRGTFPSEVFFKQGLYVVGEIGGNDYGSTHAAGLGDDQLMDLVPFVVGAIKSSIQELYKMGARSFLVVNIPSLGCNPGDRARIKPDEDTDEFGCLKSIVAVNVRHNALLKSAVEDLRRDLPDARIALGDFFGILRKVFTAPQSYGISDAYTACCGNFTKNMFLECGDTLVINGVSHTGVACTNPSQFVFWNSGHFTDRFNHIVAQSFLSGEFVDLPENWGSGRSAVTSSELTTQAQ